MCGISGFISSQYSKEDLEQMTNVLQHRGPDAGAAFFDEQSRIGLGHRRLSIIDLTTNANQPYTSQCGGYKMVFNGEIYNYKEIIKELKFKHKFEPKTNSDTEVVLEAFATWGADFVNKLNGMFAIAIWDITKKELLLFRDRLGIKPLYYYQKDDCFAFASEIKALVSLVEKENLTVNFDTITDLLHYGYATGNSSIYNEIRKVESGNYMQVANGIIVKNNSFWKIEDIVQKELFSNEDQVVKELDHKISNAVAQRMLADVPLGTFLSGGIDSSLITATAQKLSNSPINTFSIGFKDQKQDESKYAKEIAKTLKTNHNELILSEQDAIAEVDKLFDVFDEPFGDSSAIPTLLVCQMAKKQITVALSGDGGDELFLGYGMYNWAERLSNSLLYTLRKPISKSLNILGNKKYKRGALVLNAPSKQHLKSHIFSQEQYLFSKREIEQLLINPNKGNLILEEFDLSRTLNPMEGQAFFDLKNYLKDDLLVKVDRSSMFHSLEVRVPLLDHNVVSYAMNIAPQLKYKNGESKYILKQVLYQYLPKALFDRPKKGFSVPLSKWLKTDLKYLIDTFLSKTRVENAGIVRFEIVNSLIQRYLKGEDYLYNRLWMLIQIHRFFET